MKRRRILLGVLTTCAIGFGLGCTVPERRWVLADQRPRNLIFNPERTGIPPVAIARSDWPSTFAYSHPRETIDYRETINDLQGLSNSHDDYLLRRFYSVRRGRARR